MKVKAIVSEERITLPELREQLQAMESQRLESGKEMPYELRKSIEHANTLARTDAKKSRELVGILLKMDKMKPDIAFRIANIMPRTRDELRAVYAKEKYSLSTEELETIINLVKTHF